MKTVFASIFLYLLIVTSAVKPTFGTQLSANYDQTTLCSDTTFNVKFIVKIGNNPAAGAIINLTDYEAKTTNELGEAIFSKVNPAYGIEYTVSIDGYSEWMGAVSVFETDVIEEVTFSIPTFDVVFSVKLGEEPVPDAEISLEGYGIQATGFNGKTKFSNIEPQENIPYIIISEATGTITGQVTVSERDIVESITITDIETPNKSEPNIWPNPAKEYVNISTELHSTYYLYNISGELLTSGKTQSSTEQIKLSSYYSGEYVLVLHYSTSKKQFKLIIK